MKTGVLPKQGIAGNQNHANNQTPKSNSELSNYRDLDYSSIYLQAILNSSPVAIISLDPDARVLSWNLAAEELFGWTADEVMHQRYPIVDDQLWPDFYRNYKKMLAGKHYFDYYTYRKRKDGEIIPVSFSTAPLMNESDEVIGVTGVIYDRREQIEKLEWAERLSLVVEQCPVLVTITDPDGVIEYVNQTFLSLTKYSKSDVIGRNINILKSEHTRPETFTTLWQTIANGSPWKGELVNLSKDGESLYLSSLISPVRNNTGEITHYLSIQEDISEVKILTEALSKRENHDLLTGFNNRHGFIIELQRLLDKVGVEESKHVLCYVDLDQFKVINNACGLKAGDKLIKSIGQLLKDRIRQTDIIARVGSDEFAIIMLYCDLDKATTIIESLRETIETFRFVWDSKSHSVTGSIGLSVIDESHKDASDILTQTELAAYSSSEKGGNCLTINSESSIELLNRHHDMAWAARITDSIDKDRFFLVWQPIVPVSSDNPLSHYEILIRMKDEEGNTVSPGVFLPPAEKHGLMSKLDRWVISNTLAWMQKNPAVLAQIAYCSINLSGQSVGNTTIQDFIFLQIEKYGISPNKICFEITETAALSSFEEARQFIYALKDVGCQFSLDDFGSGMASFSYLKSLPVDYLKIDGSFVKNIDVDPIDLAMVRSINDIGHVMNMKTIAEFVESESILKKLKELGVDFAQGYHLGKPVPM